MSVRTFSALRDPAVEKISRKTKSRREQSGTGTLTSSGDNGKRKKQPSVGGSGRAYSQTGTSSVHTKNDVRCDLLTFKRMANGKKAQSDKVKLVVSSSVLRRGSDAPHWKIQTCINKYESFCVG